MALDNVQAVKYEALLLFRIARQLAKRAPFQMWPLFGGAVCWGSSDEIHCIHFPLATKLRESIASEAAAATSGHIYERTERRRAKIIGRRRCRLSPRGLIRASLPPPPPSPLAAYHCLQSDQRITGFVGAANVAFDAVVIGPSWAGQFSQTWRLHGRALMLHSCRRAS